MQKLPLIIISWVCLFSPLTLKAENKICEEWFKNADLKPGQDCEIECTSTKVRMDTFQCTSFCNELCKKNTDNKKYYPKTLLGSLLYYPGLTSDEKELIKKYHKESLIVFVQKEKAEAKTEKLFPNGSLNDESDAFRHFVWAGLIAALKLTKQDRLNLEELVTSALEELTKNQLSVLKPNPLINIKEMQK